MNNSPADYSQGGFGIITFGPDVMRSTGSSESLLLIAKHLSVDWLCWTDLP